jgi:hypothetical protein
MSSFIIVYRSNLAVNSQYDHIHFFLYITVISIMKFCQQITSVNGALKYIHLVQYYSLGNLTAKDETDAVVIRKASLSRTHSDIPLYTLKSRVP